MIISERPEQAVPYYKALAEIVAPNKKLFLGEERTFQRIFGTHIKPYINLVTGFDLVKFDEEVVKSGTRSMEEVLRERYGEDSIHVIKRLIGASTT